MKNVVRLFLVTACLLGSSVTSQANSIINGSFEDPDMGTGWGLFASIPGWTATSGFIEVGYYSHYGITGYDGDQVLELDSNGNSTVAQIVAGPGTFTLSFLYADRVGGLAETFDVYWNSALVGSFAPASTAMTLYSTSVTALGGLNTLEFKSTGLSDSYGALIDNVQLNQVPDAGTTSMLLGIAMLGLGVVRRMVR